MAEFAMKDLVEKKGISDQFLIESAAAFSTAIKDGIGEPVNVYAQKAMEKYGIRCCEKRARRMEPSDYEKFDHIVVMDRKNIRAVDRYTAEDTEKKLKLLLQYAGYGIGDDERFDEIYDPRLTLDYEEALEEIRIGCQGLLEYLLEER